VRLVWSEPNSQPMCACQNPLATAAGVVPNTHGECGPPVLVGERVVAAVVGDPDDDRALDRHAARDGQPYPRPRTALNARWVKWRWNPIVTPSPVRK
jgi:hypothetical protein